MAKIAPWYSSAKPFTLGTSTLGGPDVLGGAPAIHHDNDQCPDGNRTPKEYRVAGTGGLPLCERCKTLT